MPHAAARHGRSRAPSAERVGERIRKQRQAQGKTLQQVAQRSGLSVGFLSQIERNLTGITLSSLVNVAQALGVPLRELLEQPLQTAPDSHRGRRLAYAIESTSPSYERLSTVFPGSHMHSVKINVPAGYTSETVSHAGEELVFVLSGEIDYTVDTKHYALATGDSLHFDAGLPHRIAAAGSGPAEVMWVGTLRIYDDPVQEDPQEQASLCGTEFYQLTG